MPVNDLSFNQLATVLNGIVSQATGSTQITPTNTAEFVTVGQVGLLAGYDALRTAISQVLGRTIFSVRPYNRKFKGLEASEQRFGHITRKINYVDSEYTDNAKYSLTDGQSVDMYVVKKPSVIQTNFYGENVFSDYLTVYKKQLEAAMRDPQELASFWSGAIQNMTDRMEQAHENLARACLANLAGGVLDAGGDEQVIHLLTEYNAALGTSFTAQQILSPDNFKPFMAWAYARIAQVCSMLTERTSLYHFNMTGKTLMRHTPYDRQKVYMFAPARYQMEAMVLADTFHDNYLRYADVDTVNFWQNSNTPDTINVTPGYFDVTNGTVKTGSAVNQDKVFAIIFDEEAAGLTTFDREVASTPYNPRGGYTNIWYNFTERYWNDFTENVVVALLD